MMQSYVPWLVNGGGYACLLALLAYALRLPHLLSLALLLLPVALPLLYRATAFPASPHSHHFQGLLVAHRGGRHRHVADVVCKAEGQGSAAAASPPAAVVVHPENSLAAFKAASEDRLVDAVELDVWLSKDGVPVVLHDGYLHRSFEFDGQRIGCHRLPAQRLLSALTALTLAPLRCPLLRPLAVGLRAGRGHVRALTVAQLQRLTYRVQRSAEAEDDGDVEQLPVPVPLPPVAATAPSPSPASAPSAHLPTLAEVVELLLPTHLQLMVEVKEVHEPAAMARALVDLFHRHPALYRRAFVASFLPLPLLHLKRLDPLISTAALSHPHLSSLLLQQMRRLGFGVSPWLEHSAGLRWAIDALGRSMMNRRLVRWLGCSAACVHRSAVSEELVRGYQREGLSVFVWTVNDPETRAWLQRQRLSVITDFPFVS